MQPELPKLICLLRRTIWTKESGTGTRELEVCVCFCVHKEAEDMAYILCQVNMLLNTKTTVDATLLYIVHCCCRKFEISAGEQQNFTISCYICHYLI